jgi:hypothetical protein
VSRACSLFHISSLTFALFVQVDIGVLEIEVDATQVFSSA